MMFRVEWKQFDSRTGFGWTGRDFDTLLEASNFYSSVMTKADLLVFEKFRGYFFISSK